MYGVSEGPDLRLGPAAGARDRSRPASCCWRPWWPSSCGRATPIVDLRLLGNRLFRAGNGVMVLASVAFLGTLYAISLYYQDGRGLSALGSGLSTFPEAIGVMGGAQLASRVLYPRLGPRRHITIGLIGTAVSIGLLACWAPQTSLWWARLLMFTLGLSMAQVFVPIQAVSFATITPAATGRAPPCSTRSDSSAARSAWPLLTTIIVLVGPVHLVAGHLVANLTAYRAAFLAAAAICLCGVACSLAIRDADAAATIPARRQRDLEHAPEPRAA